LCMDNELPIIVFAMMQPGNVKQIVQGGKVGTLVGKVTTELKK